MASGFMFRGNRVGSPTEPAQEAGTAGADATPVPPATGMTYRGNRVAQKPAQHPPVASLPPAVAASGSSPAAPEVVADPVPPVKVPVMPDPVLIALGLVGTKGTASPVEAVIGIDPVAEAEAERLRVEHEDLVRRLEADRQHWETERLALLRQREEQERLARLLEAQEAEHRLREDQSRQLESLQAEVERFRALEAERRAREEQERRIATLQAEVERFRALEAERRAHEESVVPMPSHDGTRGYAARMFDPHHLNGDSEDVRFAEPASRPPAAVPWRDDLAQQIRRLDSRLERQFDDLKRLDELKRQAETRRLNSLKRPTSDGSAEPKAMNGTSGA